MLTYFIGGGGAFVVAHVNGRVRMFSAKCCKACGRYILRGGYVMFVTAHPEYRNLDEYRYQAWLKSHAE